MLEAARRAQLEVDLDFEQLLRSNWLPSTFDLFGMEENADADMGTARLYARTVAGRRP